MRRRLISSPYVLFEFPSNIFMKYFTPSKWIARIMVTWGIGQSLFLRILMDEEADDQ
jgi:hypothetical protein